MRDRYDLHKKRFFKKDRTVLGLGSSSIPPLRKLYLDFEDEKIYTIVEGFFSSVESKLWNDPNTLLRKTIGIQALFDVLGLILKSWGFPKDQSFDIEQCKESFDNIVSRIDVRKVDALEKNYSGSGRVAIRNELSKQIGV